MGSANQTVPQLAWPPTAARSEHPGWARATTLHLALPLTMRFWIITNNAGEERKAPQIPHPFEQNAVKGHLKRLFCKGYPVCARIMADDFENYIETRAAGEWHGKQNSQEKVRHAYGCARGLSPLAAPGASLCGCHSLGQPRPV